MVKPFEFLELLARVKALSKRNTDVSVPSEILRLADVELDLNAKVVKHAEKKN